MKLTKLKRVRISNATFLINKDLGYFPYFQWVIRGRIKRRKAVNVAVTGEAGEGKSYLAWTLCKLIDKIFSVDQIVYKYSSYMDIFMPLGLGRPIMFDEPSYAMGKRDWYKQVNKVLVQTVESQRFMVHPLYIPVINKVLLDKTIRSYLLQFQVIVRDRGKADVYRIQASQFQPKIYHHFLCELHYPLIGKCKKLSCLGCRQFKTCNEFRAQYERKKRSIQLPRYEQAKQTAAYHETQELTDRQIEKALLDYKEEILNDKGNISVARLRIIAKDELNLVIGHNRGYRIKEGLKMHYPKIFV